MPSVSVLAAMALTGLMVAGAAPAHAHPPSSSSAPSSAPAPAPAPAPASPTESSPSPATSGSHGTWRWPVGAPHHVLRRFDVGPQRWSAGHRGVDLAASPGEPVRAPASGRVRFVGVVAGQPVISVDHGELISTYQPVVSRLSAGDAVTAGEVIGTLSALPGHCMPAACLHWGVRRGEAYLDPLTLLGLTIRPIILKPLGGPG